MQRAQHFLNTVINEFVDLLLFSVFVHLVYKICPLMKNNIRGGGAEEKFRTLKMWIEPGVFHPTVIVCKVYKIY